MAAEDILFPRRWRERYDFHKLGGYLGNAGLKKELSNGFR